MESIEVLHKKKVIGPKLRFKGYTDKWKSELLGNTCRVTTGSRDTQNRVDDGVYPFFVRSNTVERINSYSFDGEAILTSGDGVGVGKNFHYINDKFDFHQRVYALLNFKENYSGKFIFQVFKEKFHKRVMRLSAKNSVDSVRMNMITDMKIYFPSLSEQQKIADFLTAVDEKTQQLNRKKQLLEQYKKGLMQQLFSGKLRFKDENGKAYPKWKEKKLGKVVKEYRLGGNYVNTEQITEYPLIKMGNLGRGAINLNKIEYIPLDAEIDIKDKINYGDLFFNTRNTLDLVGKVAIWRNELSVAYYNSNLMCLKFEHNFFMNYLLNSYQALKGLKRFATGTTSVAAIYTKDLLKLEITIPCFEEQKRIANFLSGIDVKIEAVTKQINHTQNFKKGLLQQMFV
jgi:type I restriction enzyme S subunit